MFQWRAVNSQEHPLLKPRSLPCKIDWLYHIWFRNYETNMYRQRCLGIFHLTQFWCRMNFYSASRNLQYCRWYQSRDLSKDWVTKQSSGTPHIPFFHESGFTTWKKGRQNDRRILFCHPDFSWVIEQINDLCNNRSKFHEIHLNCFSTLDKVL